jgi:hypothetical protein
MEAISTSSNRKRLAFIADLSSATIMRTSREQRGQKATAAAMHAPDKYPFVTRCHSKGL